MGDETKLTSNPKLLVGCPVHKRDWILPAWKEHVIKACDEAGIDPLFVFVASESDAPSVTWDDSVVRLVEEPQREDKRDWSRGRLLHMVYLRNILLDEVRSINPEMFLSLDSDILLNEMSIVGMLEGFKDDSVWAVGGKAFMSRGRLHPSYGTFISPGKVWTGFKRKDSNSLSRVDIIMAVKMMNRSAYNVDYVFHRHGEDIGWSSAVAEAGGKLFWDGRYCSKHVMNRELLGVIDERCGY